ncbi:ADP-ribosylation factor-binding protein GGA1 isoform X3 [Carettochelys insculpta]|uniref:ADP-ribosylation factor-binding protein GGA1 isoform X3 n=1 Tax=Carettochelys insculpta TaxID=44489 RepID=UPI003EB7495C
MEPDALESRINKATNPLNKDLDWDSINAFCEQLNKELEGPQLATRLLAHKIQSPQEWEAIQALTVLETCMKNCGERFHDEVGKFRFLNELIKVVSPKYLGSRTPEKVKSKILELMYSWTLGLPHEVKITEAYQMLKKQGIVKCDPKLPDEAPFPLPPPRPKNIIFDDEEKSKMLARLLKSSHPEDLRAANKLIKEMVQELFPLQDQKRMEKISKRTNAIEEVNNNVKLLTEMVTNYSKGETTESSEDLMKELYQRCERMRPMLFRLASDTEDNDEALAEILQANDNLTQVINLYKQLVRGEEINGETVAGSLRGSTSALLDLSGLDMPAPGPSYPALPTLSGGSMLPVPDPASSVSLLDDELMSLGLNEPVPASAQAMDSGGWNSFQLLLHLKQRKERQPRALPLSPVAWMTWICWGRLCYNSPCLRSLSKSDGRSSRLPGSRYGTSRTRLALAPQWLQSALRPPCSGAPPPALQPPCPGPGSSLSRPCFREPLPCQLGPCHPHWGSPLPRRHRRSHWRTSQCLWSPSNRAASSQ